jgi:Zn-dependent protease
MPDVATELERASGDIALTRDAREILEHATADAVASGHDQVTTSDVLKATLDLRRGLARQAIGELGIDADAISAQLPSNGAASSISLRQLLVNANREAQVLGHFQVDSIHLLLAMLYSDSPLTAAALQKAGLTLYDIRRYLQTSPQANASPTQHAAPTPDKALRRRPWPSLRGVLTISPVFLGIIAITAVSGVLLSTNLLPGFAGPLTIAFVTFGWIASLCIHEFGHAMVAYLGGDRSVVASGYLTLNPLRYTNLLLSLIMPVIFLLLGGIGLPGGAVYINHSALRSKAWSSAVSAAGPVGTLLCGLLVALPFLLPGRAAWLSSGNFNFWAALAFLGFIEAVAIVLNLLPVPGLDGFGMIRPWLPYSLQDLAIRAGGIGLLAVFAILWYVAPIRDVFFETVFNLTSLVRIAPQWIIYGQSLMRFH